MITVRVIPWAQIWPAAKPIFYAPEVSGALDSVSIHLYPGKGEVDRALTAMATYDIGKPLLIEKTFPLSCSLEEWTTSSAARSRVPRASSASGAETRPNRRRRRRRSRSQH